MGLQIGLPNAGSADVRIDLGCSQTFVPQHLLDAANIGAAIEQVSGKAVSKRVGGGASIEPTLLDVLLEHSRDAASGKSIAKLVDERCLLFAVFR